MAKSGKKSSTLSEFGPLLGIGIQLAAAVGVFGLIGWWADQRLGTEPWLMLVGLLLGATGGMISFIRTALKTGRKERGT